MLVSLLLAQQGIELRHIYRYIFCSVKGPRSDRFQFNGLRTNVPSHRMRSRQREHPLRAPIKASTPRAPATRRRALRPTPVRPCARHSRASTENSDLARSVGAPMPRTRAVHSTSRPCCVMCRPSVSVRVRPREPVGSRRQERRHGPDQRPAVDIEPCGPRQPIEAVATLERPQAR